MSVLRFTFLAVMCFAGGAVMAQSAPPVRDATTTEIEAIRAGMESRLLDAQSARFANVKIKAEHMCGMVNAKNRMGAYVGYKPFSGMIFRDTTGKLLAAPMGPSEHEEVDRAMCEKSGIPLPP